MTQNSYNKVSVLIVGAGPAGLSAAIAIKKAKPDLSVCVIDKAASLGNHNLSGAVLEPAAIEKLLDLTGTDWRNDENAQKLLANKIDTDDVLFMLSDKYAFKVNITIKLAKMLGLGFGQMDHMGDMILSVSKLTKYLGETAAKMGVELMMGFAAEDMILDQNGNATGIKLVDQGKSRGGHNLPNYLPGETINADFIILAEGCDGLVTEKFASNAGLARQQNQLYSVGIKEVLRVSPEQYKKFGENRVVHAMGYPIWTPLVGPNMFGGGIMYSYGENHIAVGMIVGTDWKYCDFNPQDALELFKKHAFVKQYIEGATVVSAGAKMIPEGGFLAVPRDPATGSIGKNNVIILGDSAGFVNMLKIKGLHNAIQSGILAADAIAACSGSQVPASQAAVKYTSMVDSGSIGKEMKSAQNFRQTVAKLGPTFGFPLSVFAGIFPKFKVEKDFEAMRCSKYKYKGSKEFDKDTFTALAATHHREDQPCHLSIIDPAICREKCEPTFNRPCVTFCPAGVYESIQGTLKPANPSNCLHCKTCQRKCPFDNIRWTVPEGTGGPRYQDM